MNDWQKRLPHGLLVSTSERNRQRSRILARRIVRVQVRATMIETSAVKPIADLDRMTKLKPDGGSC
ncbi:hypothetical protein ASE86_13220 [Sphingomonas sp. Leaf33]|nr:hypothetical protein ASE86_13220 [Sphingomonas sp. Leaf33]